MATWWNTKYRYRKQITITAPAGKTVPVGYPINLAEDQDALETAGRLLANRNDWRIVYWGGSSWTDLPRQIISDTQTMFGAQAAVSAGTTNTDHYLYYGNASEATSKVPTSEADWNDIYVPHSIASTLYLVHCKEGTSTALADTDSGGATNLTLVGGGWVTSSNKFGYAVNLAGAVGQYISVPSLDIDAFTFECFLKRDNISAGGESLVDQAIDTLKWNAGFNAKDLIVNMWGQSGSNSGTWTNFTPDTNWHHVAISFDGSVNATAYLDGVSKGAKALNGGGQIIMRAGASTATIGKSLDGRISNIRLRNVATSSFDYAFTDSVGTSTGEEVAGSTGAFLNIL